MSAPKAVFARRLACGGPNVHMNANNLYPEVHAAHTAGAQLMPHDRMHGPSNGLEFVTVFTAYHATRCWLKRCPSYQSASCGHAEQQQLVNKETSLERLDALFQVCLDMWR
jgi:hypothetical protein